MSKHSSLSVMCRTWVLPGVLLLWKINSLTCSICKNRNNGDPGIAHMHDPWIGEYISFSAELWVFPPIACVTVDSQLLITTMISSVKWGCQRCQYAGTELCYICNKMCVFVFKWNASQPKAKAHVFPQCQGCSGGSDKAANAFCLPGIMDHTCMRILWC